MAGIKYSVDELQRLRESPLVKKPDGLPSIEQWMDVPNDQNNNNAGNTGNRRPRAAPRDSDVAVTGADRSTLNPMGQFGRRQSSQPEDTVLGPPKNFFASAARPKTGQSKEPTGIISIDGDYPGDRLPRGERGERWRVDRDGNREKGYPNGRRARGEDGDGWTNVKGRKSLGQEDFDRGFARNGDRERDKKDGDQDNADAPSRRTAGSRWTRRDDNAKEGESSRLSGAGQGGWRDRERNRERDRDRDWTRSAKEEDPEWMDAPVTKKETKAHTQEDFQRWKEQMRAKDAPVEEKEEPKIDLGPGHGALPTTVSTNPSVKPLLTPSAVEPSLGGLFGNWGKEKAGEATPAEIIPVKTKTDKKSRFMTMFAKPEEATAPAQPPQVTPASPTPVAESNADKEGFQRILQMLGGTNLGTTSSSLPSAPAPTNGIRQGGISLDYLLHQSPPPEAQENRAPPQQSRQTMSRTLETQALLENILAPRPTAPESRTAQQARFTNMSPDNALFEQFGAPRPDSNRPGDDFPLQQPPSRNNNAQDANLAAILNSRSREDMSRDQRKQQERDFLLTLMQQPRATPPQLINQNLPRPAPDTQGIPFFDQPLQRPQGQPKGRGAPPGFIEESRLFTENEIMRREAERRDQHLREQINIQQQQQQEALRNKNRGMPMGFPGHDEAALAGLQRRNTAGEIPRQMTNMGIPSQPVPDLGYMGARQPGMPPPTPQDRPNIPPPPGFGGPMRQPPGLGGPGPQQQMGPGPSFSAGNTPLGHPPGFPPPNTMRGGMFPGPGGNGMQGPPQSYFPPPGYGPPMGLRGEDPRTMFEQQFGGPNPRQQGRPGPPNMY